MQLDTDDTETPLINCHEQFSCVAAKIAELRIRHRIRRKHV